MPFAARHERRTAGLLPSNSNLPTVYGDPVGVVVVNSRSDSHPVMSHGDGVMVAVSLRMSL